MKDYLINTVTYKMSFGIHYSLYWCENLLFYDTKSRLYLDSWAYHRFWTLWPYRHNHKTWFSSGSHFHR